VRSVSTSQVEAKPFSPFQRKQHSFFFDGRVKVSSLALGMQMAQITVSLTFPSSEAVQALLRKKFNRILEAPQIIEQQELWSDGDVQEEHVGPILVTVHPLPLPTDQVHMVWIARLELRDRIKQFHRQKYYLLNRSSQAAKDFLFFLGDEYLIKNKRSSYHP
jgi:hypothetical protein